MAHDHEKFRVRDSYTLARRMLTPNLHCVSQTQTSIKHRDDHYEGNKLTSTVEETVAINDSSGPWKFPPFIDRTVDVDRTVPAAAGGK